MKRIINSVFELFVLVIFCDLSAANPPMWGGGGSSSSSAVKKSEPWIYGLSTLARVKPTGITTRTWRNPRIYIENYHNADKFKYKLLGAYDEVAYENSGRDTNLVFYYARKMKIQAPDDKDAVYHLNFEQENEANLVVEYMLSADSARFSKCTGNDTYKFEKLYHKMSAGPLFEVAEKLCIFKIRKSGKNLYVIRRREPIADQPLTLCVFRSEDYSMPISQNLSNNVELRLNWQGDILQPTYVLESHKPDKMRNFIDTP